MSQLQSFTKYLRQALVFTGKVELLFFRRFLLVLTKISFWVEDWALGNNLRSFQIFLIFSNFPRSKVLCRSPSYELTRICQFVTSIRASFHFWLKESFLNIKKSQNITNIIACKIFFCFFISSLTALIVKSSHTLDGIYFMFLKKCPRKKMKGFQYQI